MIKVRTLLIALIGAMCITACSKDDKEAPVVDTIEQINATENDIMVKGNVVNPGSGAVITRGIVYSTAENPVRGNIDVINVVAETEGTGEYSVTISMSSLQMNSIYYFRAYAISQHGLTYGKQITYTTPTHLPKMATLDPEKISSTSYKIGGELVLTGGEAIVAHGLLYTSRTGEFDINSPDVTIANLGVIGEPDTFWVNISELAPGTKYYVKSYATNNKGTGYGDVKSFITPSPYPTTEITKSEMISANEQLIEVMVHGQGLSDLIEVGVVYAITERPALGLAGSTAIVLGNQMQTYITTLESLIPDTTYYIRAYAKNSDGMTYSAEHSFTSGLSTPD